MAYTHFEYESGANPYIAFNDKEAERVIRVHQRRGNPVTKLKENFYRIDDTFVFKRTGRDFDFIATFENNKDYAREITFTSETLNGERIYIDAHDWVGILADDTGRAMVKAFEKDEYYIAEPLPF